MRLRVLPVTGLTGEWRLSILRDTVVCAMAALAVMTLGLACWVVLSRCGLGLTLIVRSRYAVGLARSTVWPRGAVRLIRGIVLSSCLTI